jgi:uncharacterized protein (TIGR02452 family)
MYNRKFTPNKIASLQNNEIFVFGSNLDGLHGGGAARVAYQKFGAQWGKGVGIQGKSYGIPTMHGGVDVIKPYVDDFIEFALSNKEYTFLVTRIGCGIAGFKANEIAPLFTKAIEIENILLPEDFVQVIEGNLCGNNSFASTWDSKDFLNEYYYVMNTNNYYNVKKLRVEEFKNTIAIVNNGFYYTEEGCKVSFDKTEKMFEGTCFYSTAFNVDNIKANTQKTIIEVVNADCIKEGIRLLDMGYNPAILNMANRQNPGGGVISGSGAQEEGIFRRTNIFHSLYQFASYAEEYNVKKSKFQYPLDKNFGGVYSPCVSVFRESEKAGYKLMSKTREIAFITVAALNHPSLNENGMIVDDLVEPTKNKIRTILRIGLKHEHDSLILGALGCGAFHNPPKHIARLFHEVLEEEEFLNKYKHIVFAILEDHNSYKKHNNEGNYLPFKNEFAQ